MLTLTRTTKSDATPRRRRCCEIAPRPAQAKLPVWLGALSPETVARASGRGHRLALPMLGGTTDRYAQLAGLYRRAWVESGRSEAEVQIAVFSHLHVAETAREAREDFHPFYAAYLEPLFKGPMPRATFEQWCSPEGSLVAGSVADVIEKLTRTRERLGMTRYVGQIDIGGQPFDAVTRGLDLYAGAVAAAVRSPVS